MKPAPAPPIPLVMRKSERLVVFFTDHNPRASSLRSRRSNPLELCPRWDREEVRGIGGGREDPLHSWHRIRTGSPDPLD